MSGYAQRLLFPIACLAFMTGIHHVGATGVYGTIFGHLASMESKEILLISDFDNEQKTALAQDLMEMGHEMTLVEVQNYKSVTRNCDNVDPEAHSYVSNRRAFLVVVWVGDHHIDRALTLLSNSVVECSLEINLGWFDMDNTILFVMNKDDTMGKDLVFQNRWIQWHSKSGVLTFNNNNNTIDVIYFDVTLNEKRRAFKGSTKDFQNLKARGLFRPIRNMNSYPLRISTLPVGYFFAADEDPNPKSPRHLHTAKSTGYEMSILREASRVLNFEFEITNPADYEWGLITNRTWSGMVGDIVDDLADIGLGALVTASRLKVIEPSIVTDYDLMIFAAPKPQPRFDSLTLLAPLSYSVWACFIVSLAAMSITVLNIYNVEESLTGTREDVQYSSTSYVWWYCFATGLGQSITRTIKYKEIAVRVAIGTWILVSFIISTAYGGTLRAILTTPQFSPPIDTFAKVIESGIPWDMVLYGEELEVALAKTKDPILSKVWSGKNVVDFEPVITDRLTRVMNGELIAIDWISHMLTNVYVSFKTPGGEELVDLSKDYLFKAPVAWLMRPTTVGHREIRQVIMRMSEAGLVDVWRQQAMEQIKEQGNVPLAAYTPFSALRKMTTKDYQGVFMFMGIFLTISILVFAYEVIPRPRQELPPSTPTILQSQSPGSDAIPMHSLWADPRYNANIYSHLKK